MDAARFLLPFLSSAAAPLHFSELTLLQPGRGYFGWGEGEGGLASLIFEGSKFIADGHTASNAPDLFRPPKLSNAGPG